ncbi:hypothetical protein JOF56_005201 [Kibdelosporangium banguiense]|uniref:Uncharacterized protein n=1 Tax=Kibdelosporangium banguiense TaxID=1365924 RepID=A0ABS4TKB8_9PSEU|nr:hypothetical protein [Kibdelosporangium banguiense]MBP2324816.1 hypothetical protein [Kibdelosporangium banguiense]
MTEPRSDEVVHQAFFGWSPDQNKHTILASSLDELTEQKWRVRLQDHVRLQPVHGGGGVPHSAMSYLTFGEDLGAVVRRVHLGHSPGRGNAHVLIGWKPGLDVSLALRLENWPQWRVKVPETGLMEQIALSSLVGAAGPAGLRPEEVDRLEPMVVTVLARLLDHPDEPLSIIGCPDADRLALVRCLHAAADPHLRKNGIRRCWSYSTYEDRHGDSIANLPEIVFLPMRSPDTSARRNVVDLDRGSRVSSYTGLANQLIAALCEGTPEAVVADADLNGSWHSDQTREVAVPRQPEPVAAVRKGLRESVPSQQVRGTVAQKTHRVEDVGARAVEDLLAATTVMDLHSFLFRLAKLDDRGRESLRAAADVRVLDRIVEFVEVDARYQLMSKLLEVMYGADGRDLRSHEAQRHAARLVQDGQSEQIAIMLGVAGKRHNTPQIVEAAYKRWSVSGLQPRHVARRLRFGSKRWHLPMIAAVALLAVLALVFVLGYLAGGPAQVQQSAATPQPEVTTPAPVQPNPPPVVAGTVHIALPNSNQQVYAFVTVGKIYYPQGLCTIKDEPSSIWLCTKTGNPPESPGIKAELVAVAVPQTHVAWLNGAAAAGRDVERRGEWGNPTPVVPS